MSSLAQDGTSYHLGKDSPKQKSISPYLDEMPVLIEQL
jgi:hypothetical protein